MSRSDEGLRPLNPHKGHCPLTHPPVTQFTFPSNMPVKRRETASLTGTAANAASRMQCIREKQKKRRRRKFIFSHAVFLFLLCP